MSTIQEQYEAAWHAKFGAGGTHEHRRSRGSYPDPEMCVHPMPRECPCCHDVTNWAAVNEMYTRFVCWDCWHAWGTEKEGV